MAQRPIPGRSPNVHSSPDHHASRSWMLTRFTLAMVPVAVERYGARTVWWTVADARYDGGKSDGSSIADPHHGGAGGGIG